MAWDFDASPFRAEPEAGSSPVSERTWSGGDLSVLLQIDVHHRPFLRVPGLDLDGESVWVADVEPITGRAPALEAALEAALYCPDVIDEVPFDEDATLDRLAKTLLQPMWRLWWD